MEASKGVPLSITQKPGVATGGNICQRREESDLTLVLTDLKSVSIELFGSKGNIFKAIFPNVGILSRNLPIMTTELSNVSDLPARWGLRCASTPATHPWNLY
jgi:hypothetical protein